MSRISLFFAPCLLSVFSPSIAQIDLTQLLGRGGALLLSPLRIEPVEENLHHLAWLKHRCKPVNLGMLKPPFSTGDNWISLAHPQYGDVWEDVSLPHRTDSNGVDSTQSRLDQWRSLAEKLKIE